MSLQRSGRPRPAPPHLDDETLERFASGELDSETRQRVERHAADCPPCAALLSGLTLLRAGARHFDPAVPPSGKRRLSVWVPLAIAATVAIAIILPATRALHRGASPAPSNMRSASGESPVPVSPAGEWSEPPSRFQWRATRDTTAYEVLLFREDGTVVWQERTSDTSINRRPDVQLSPGRYYWRVRALSENGIRGESSLVQFEITRR